MFTLQRALIEFSKSERLSISRSKDVIDPSGPKFFELVTAYHSEDDLGALNLSGYSVSFFDQCLLGSGK
jgi:hypothetical protein